jgi:hypothetical protein
MSVKRLANLSYKTVSVLLAVIALYSCAHKAPDGAVPGRITVSSVNNSPYQTTWINHYVPKGINDYAYYPIVDGSNDAPYILGVTILNSNSNVAGFTPTYSGTKVVYRVRIEYQASLSDFTGKNVWTRTGWAEHNSESNAIYTMAKGIGKAMAEDGLLDPGYYSTEAMMERNSPRRSD